ncbi:MAG: hypothetical protein GF388_12295 [Candidatus Aegiribacteria sp.]|nr:hypothetical protein [Candidatus Aegiribacteria sp.]MBD3295727.1 hypothetical protein [Candidatus Fermentibacteria bacterium]
MKDSFSFDVRVLMCRNCGAPLKTGFAGGNVKCGYCDTVNRIVARKEAPVEPMAAAREIFEEDRLRMLRNQDGLQPEVPQALKPLLSDGSLAEWKVNEALALWRSTCSELASSNDYAMAELLLYLTYYLANHFSGDEDDLRERAMYESALEVFTLPRHRQIMRGCLARQAALAGDVDDAEKWLAPCNPRSEDLESDTAYRVSKAEILTVRQDYSGVLDILGEDLDTVPIHSVLDGKAIVQRANALEKTGRKEEGARQLLAYMLANGSSGQDAIQSIKGVYRETGVKVCEDSLTAAEEMFSRESGIAASRMDNPMGCFGQIFAIVGVLLIILGVVLYNVLPDQRGGVIVALLVPAVVGVVFVFIGTGHILKARRTLRLHTRGIQGRAVVRSMEYTGMKINDVPQYRLEVEVEAEGLNPYTSEVKVLCRESEKQKYSTGSKIAVRIDPDDPHHLSVVG